MLVCSGWPLLFPVWLHFLPVPLGQTIKIFFLRPSFFFLVFLVSDYLAMQSMSPQDSLKHSFLRDLCVKSGFFMVYTWFPSLAFLRREQITCQTAGSERAPDYLQSEDLRLWSCCFTCLRERIYTKPG